MVVMSKETPNEKAKKTPKRKSLAKEEIEESVEEVPVLKKSNKRKSIALEETPSKRRKSLRNVETSDEVLTPVKKRKSLDKVEEGDTASKKKRKSLDNTEKGDAETPSKKKRKSLGKTETPKASKKKDNTESSIDLKENSSESTTQQPYKPCNKVKVTQFGPKTTEERLRKYFKNAKSVHLFTTDQGSVLRRAIIELPTVEDATTAVSERNGTVLNNFEIRVEQMIPTDRLYVGNVNKTTTPGILKDALEASTVIINSKKRFAIAKFSSIEKATYSLNKYNGRLVSSQKVILDYCLPRGYNASVGLASANPPSATLYVENLADNVTEEVLKETFKNSLCATVLSNHDGKSKRLGYVVFNNYRDAMKSRIKLNDSVLEGNKIKINYAFPPSNVLHIRNLSFDTSIVGLKKFFEKCLTARIPTNDAGKSKGFGFVSFKTAYDAKQALLKHNNQLIDDCKVNIEFARPKSSSKSIPEETENVATTKLKIYHLPFETTVEELKEIFTKAVDAQIPKYPDGRSRGFGFVAFDSVSDASESMEKFHHTKVKDRKIRIKYSYDTKSKKKS